MPSINIPHPEVLCEQSLEGRMAALQLLHDDCSDHVRVDRAKIFISGLTCRR